VGPVRRPCLDNQAKCNGISIYPRYSPPRHHHHEFQTSPLQPQKCNHDLVQLFC
jgi:hypothetical protein